MEKRVYCEVRQSSTVRQRRVKFVSETGVADIVILEKELRKEPSFVSILNKKIIVFQQEDEKGRLCDIDEFDVINDGSVIKVALLPATEEYQVPVETRAIENLEEKVPTTAPKTNDDNISVPEISASYLVPSTEPPREPSLDTVDLISSDQNNESALLESVCILLKHIL